MENTQNQVENKIKRGRKAAQIETMTVGEVVNRFWKIRHLVKSYPVFAGSVRPMTVKEVSDHLKKVVKSNPDAVVAPEEFVVKTGGATFGELVEGVQNCNEFAHESKDQVVSINLTNLKKLATERAVANVESCF